MWGTSCDLLNPSLFERDFIKKCRFQKAQLFGFHGVWLSVLLAWHCFMAVVALVQSWQLSLLWYFKTNGQQMKKTQGIAAATASPGQIGSLK